MILAPGTLAKLKDDAWPENELSPECDCNTDSTGGGWKALPRWQLCGQLAEIINPDYYGCCKAWLPLLECYIICYQERFEPLTKHANTR